MRILSLLLLCLGFVQVHAQENFNLELIANVEFAGEESNDIWGYVDDTGVEYAIIGNARHTRIFSLADPANPELVSEIPGAQSVWRDMKVWEDHIYVTTDQGEDGLLIIDMSKAPETITHNFWRPEIQGDSLDVCHNLYIDENGFCYLAGCNIRRGGILILDIVTDPKEPILLGIEDVTYSHDVYVRDNRMYCSEINDGRLAIYDVNDKADPQFVSSVETSFSFCHNAWPSDDGNYVFTTDERANAFVDAYDISDIEDMKRIDMFQPRETAGNDVIPHNTHVLGNYLVTSWYTDGVVITDATHPDNLIKVGSFDTWLGPDGGFNGTWGAYPYLPSGLVLVSDIQTGLYVFSPTYVQASYLEGTVTDMADGSAINGVNVEILASQLNEAETNPQGLYKTGIAEAGTYTVAFTHPDYLPAELDVTISAGEVTILDAQLEKLPTFELTGQVFDAVTNEPIPNAKVLFLSASRRQAITADIQGVFKVEVFDENVQLIAGSWGYLHGLKSGIAPTNPGDLNMFLDPGYMDDYILDLGWSESTGEAETGLWERGVPIGTFFQGQESNISRDMPNDIGDMCLITGNGGGAAGDDDIDDGATSFTSSRIDLTGYDNPVLTFNHHFFNAGGFGGQPNDFMVISLWNDNTTELVGIDVINENTGGWAASKQYFLKDFHSDLTNFQISFLASDDDPGHLLEAAIDRFRIEEGEVNAVTDQLSDVDIVTSPNPFETETTLSWDLEMTKLEVYQINGKLVESLNIKGQRSFKLGQAYEHGSYVLKMSDKEGKYKTMIVIKQ